MSESPIPKAEREQWITERIERLVDGVTYAAYYRSGKAQLTLNEDARQAFVDLRVLLVVERDDSVDDESDEGVTLEELLGDGGVGAG